MRPIHRGYVRELSMLRNTEVAVGMKGEPLTTETAPMRPTRLNLNLSEQVRADLEELSKATGCNLTEIVRFGLRLARLYYELGNEERLGVFDKEGRLVREIVPPWGRRL
jgi:hypothetical protein